MGRRRKGNRNRKKQQKVWAQFHSNSTKQTFDDEIDRERFDLEQIEQLENIAELKKDILSRTVIVGSVKPLGEQSNKDALKRFMEQRYGPVQKVGLDRMSSGKFPRGRVTFNFKRDAEKIFEGVSLLDASKERTQVSVCCDVVGHKGSITVRPAMEYRGMVRDDLNATSIIQVNSAGLSLGHWFPRGRDACSNVPGLEHIGKDMPNTWLEEDGSASNVNPIIRIDMEKAVIELDITHCLPSSQDVTHILMGALEDRRVCISLRFKDLTHPMKLCHNATNSFLRKSTKYFLLFELRHPPRLALVSTNPATGFVTTERLTSIQQFPSLGQQLGSCLGYKLEVHAVEINRLLNAKAFGKLKGMGLFQFDEYLDLLHHAEDVCIEQVRGKRIQMDRSIASLPHRLGLRLRSVMDANSCTWFDMLHDTVMSRNILQLVKDSNEELAERVLNVMKEMHGKTRFPSKMFNALYSADADIDEPPRLVPHFCVSLPRVLITPLRVSVSGFEIEMSNRIVRKFIDENGFSREAFIRVSIGDENTDKLFSDDISQAVETRIRELVLNGITCGKRKYVFLAYSSSQLKEQSLWMVSPENGWNVAMMRTSMGDFSMCKTPSKYAARIGQCFSTTVDTAVSGAKSNSLLRWGTDMLGISGVSHGLRVNDNLPDIVSDSGLEHSDGVGLIRRELLDVILKEVPFGPIDKKGISAIQIRYGGAKGVLVAWDFSMLKNTRCNGYDIALRPSMVKFKAPYNNLEVVTIARRIPYYLNRNVIMLGQHHGITPRTFQELQGNHIESLNRMLSDAEFALSFLPCLSGPDNGLMTTLQNMLCAGVKPELDPFLYSCLHCTRSHHLMNLRKKARIHIKDGAVLIGGIDELGLLPENCIYAQVRKPDGDYMVLQGSVMVTKHPVMHPGDMRMLTAVDIPALRGHKDVILFSQHGHRPEADKMSGSDLDGDQFAITWDRRLFLMNTALPMDYSPAKKSDESITINDSSLLQHFIDHARNDNLGRISMLWIDHASIKRNAGCSECLELAKLASIAVDFPKSGIPAVVPKELMLPQSVPRAHWRERKGLPSFHCESAVGKLYDQVVNEMESKRHKSKHDCVAMAGRYYDNNNGQILHLGDMHRILKAKQVVYNPLFARRLGWKGDDLDAALLNFSEHQRSLYEDQLLELMNQFNIKSEGEVATGCILKYHKLHKRRRHDVSEEVRRQFRSICKLFRSEFFAAVYHLVHNNMSYFGDDEDIVDDDVSDEDLEWVEAAATGSLDTVGEKSRKAIHMSCRLAGAYYVVTYSHFHHDAESKLVLYSFCWVVSDVIAYGINE